MSPKLISFLTFLFEMYSGKYVKVETAMDHDYKK